MKDGEGPDPDKLQAFDAFFAEFRPRKSTEGLGRIREQSLAVLFERNQPDVGFVRGFHEIQGSVVG